MTRSQEIPVSDREDFARYLEVRMTELRGGLDELIEMHERFGDTLQKTYLYRARHALKDGLDWFDWSRKRARHHEDFPRATDGPPTSGA